MTGTPVPRTWLLLLVAAYAAAGCGQRPLDPVPLDSRNDACRFCRMTVVDMRFAAQIVAPGEEPVMFDDLGCLTHYIKGRPLAPGAVVYVGDYGTRTWVRADEAVFTRVEGLETPMGSGLVAHGSAAARDADPVARAGAVVAFDDVVPQGPRGGATR